MDVAKLLEPHGDDAKSGENLEYDPAFVEMELVAQPGEERQEGDKILEAEDPDYADVVQKAEAVLERSHDIRAAVFYAEAVLHTRGLPGFAEATAFVRGCLETYWDSCHPELDEDDDNDPTMRINAVQGLSGGETVIRALRRTALTDSRMFGQMSLRSMDIADGTIAAPADMTEIPDTAAISAAFQDTDSEKVQGIVAAAQAAEADIAAIDAIFIEKTPGQGPDLAAVSKTLKLIVRRIADASGVAVGDEEPEAEVEGEETVGAPRQSPAGAINSQADVLNALDRIIAYYARSEPSSPVPILLERSKRLVGADFVSILNDIAPIGMDQLKQAGGIKD